MADTTIIAASTRVARAEVAPNTRRGGDLRVLLSPKTVGCTAGFMGVLTLGVGEHVNEHYHPYSEEYLYVVEGQLEMTLGGHDGSVTALGRDDALLVPIGVRHRLRNVGDGPARAVFQLSPLAPRPDLGHVDVEEPVRPEEGHAAVEGTPAAVEGAP